MTDVQRLAEILADRYGHVEPAESYGWQHPALNVIDCVLSLNRPYRSVVLPRVEAFRGTRSEIRSLADLRALVDSYASPAEFSRSELNYNDPQRAATLSGVLDYLIEAQAKQDGDSEAERLKRWAVDARPGDYLTVGVRGFGLAGFQYLRMLFGAQTVKPDVHIVRFVSEVLKRPVTNVQALYLLEHAAEEIGLPIREVDGAVWDERARA